jgi:hypothetical protein
MRFLLALVVLAGATACWAQGPRLVSATFWGTAGDDAIEDGAIAEDGTLWIAGNTASPVGRLPDGTQPTQFGQAVRDWTYGCGFVGQLSDDGTKVLRYAQFAPGVAKVTSVQVNSNGVYVGGYASPGLEPLIGDLGGLLAKGRFDQRSLKTWCPPEHFSEPERKAANDQRGAPFVLRLSRDLARIECGTFLEGWQSVWHVPKPLGEDHDQPTAIGLLSGGDIVVAHDGGYNKQPPAGKPAGFEEFYDVGDHLSRLGADLKTRAWRRDIYTPSVDPAKVNRYQNNSKHFSAKWKTLPFDWKLPHLGNTRILRMRVGPGDAIALSGWSPTRTSGEPWWSPFLLKYGADGREVWRAWTVDPMSGGGDRLGGQVSDACVRSVAFDAEGNVLASMIGDGGNNILRWDPRDPTRRAPALRGSVGSFPGRVLFWGGVARLDKESRQLLGGNHLAAYGPARGGRSTGSHPYYRATWAEDVAALPDGRVLAVGQNNGGYVTTAPWFADSVGGLVVLYDREFAVSFSTTVADARLRTLAARGSRALVMGSAPAKAAPTTRAIASSHAGGRDGYLMVVEVPSPAP